MQLLKKAETVSFLADRLCEHIAAMRGETALIRNLTLRCEAALASEPMTVTKRTLHAPTGDPHDYASMGPYWWPDPSKPDGLPYIRRDGEFNPVSRDTISFDHFFDEVYWLTLGALYAENGRDRVYAERAVRDIEVFFLDGETKVHPHLRYAQGIPGICDGRGIGLIDTRNSITLFDTVGILDALGVLPKEDLRGLKAWFDAYLNWMLTDENGADEDSQHNNHGTWYDVQVAATAIFLGRNKMAKDRLLSAYDRRLRKHIKPDGSQPFELARTDAPGYSSMNLYASTMLAKMAKHTKSKVDYFGNIPEGYRAPLPLLALEYLLPYAADMSDFPYQNIHGGTPAAAVCRLAALMLPEYPDARLHDYSAVKDPSIPEEGITLADVVARFADDEMFWRLLPTD